MFDLSCWSGTRQFRPGLTSLPTVGMEQVQSSLRKQCCRKETVWCRSCSYRFKVRHAFTISLIVDKLRKPRLQSSKHIGTKQNLTQMPI